MPGLSADMSVQVLSPDSADVGDEISLVVSIQNLRGDLLEIDEILFPSELLKAVEVISISPGSTTKGWRGPFSGFEIGHIIGPVGALDITITMQALRGINFSGDIQVRSGYKFAEAEAFVVIIGPDPTPVAAGGDSVPLNPAPTQDGGGNPPDDGGGNPPPPATSTSTSIPAPPGATATPTTTAIVMPTATQTSVPTATQTSVPTATPTTASPPTSTPTQSPPGSYGHHANPSPIGVGGGASYVTHRPPPGATDTIDSASEFISKVVDNGSVGDVFFINGTIDLTGYRDIEIPAGVVLTGNRGQGNTSILKSDDEFADCTIANCNFLDLKNSVRVIGLIIDGAFDPSDFNVNRSRAIRVGGPNVSIENCEIRYWQRAGVDLQTGNASIEYNHFHHIAVYHVIVNNEADATMIGNLFEFHWHAIAGSGDGTQNYTALYNLAIRQQRPTEWGRFGYGGRIFFDMHDPCTNCTIDIRYNTFQKLPEGPSDPWYDEAYDLWFRGNGSGEIITFRWNVMSRGTNEFGPSYRIDGSGTHYTSDNIVGP
jgi:hypothetical protein